MKTIIAMAAVAFFSLAAPQIGLAADHEVKMLNRGEMGNMVFEPAYLKVARGDRVIFVATDPGHNAENIAGMIPAGAAPFKGSMGKALTVTFEKDGVYGYKCLPHMAMGMVGLIVVGNARSNLDSASATKLPGKAGQVMAKLLAHAVDQVAATH